MDLMISNDAIVKLGSHIHFNPNLGGGCISLNNSETVKAVNLAFCSIN